MNNLNFHIGCSSYATSSWQPLFYPEGLPKKEWFAYYSKNFSTYELNATFYRFPTAKSLLSWYDKAPVDYKFSVKVPKTITHIKKLQDCKDEIKKFYAVIEEGLKDKLACVFFQLPPSFSYSLERLHMVIDAIDTNFINVVEFRNESWWRQDVFDVFIKRDIIFCSVNYPKLPSSIVKTNQTGYVRMHGNPKLFYSEYSLKEIEHLCYEISSLGFKETYIYFNNTAATGGIINALQTKKNCE